jgi:spermidine synthase
MRHSYVLNPLKMSLVLGGIALSLAGLSLVGEYLLEVVFADNESTLLSLIDLFSVNVENSIPTWYSTFLLLLAALILALIAHTKWIAQDLYRWHWAGLAVTFLYLSIDEGAGIHEYLADPLFLAFNTSGYLYFGWQIVAVPLVIVFGLTYVRFLLHLTPAIRYGFIVAAVIYTGGALFVEGLSASYLYDQNGVIDFTYLAIATVEETFEMLGIVVFISVLLTYMRDERAYFEVSWSTNEEQRDDQGEEATKSKLGKQIPDILEQGVHWIIQSSIAPYLIVFFAGMNLILIQWVLVRELTTMLRGTELVILLVTASYFSGLSIGYRSAGWVKRKWLTPMGSAVLFLHLALPIWFRLLVVWLDRIGAFGIAFLILPLIVPFIVSAFYSIFLPLFVDDDEGQLTSLYAVEVLGSATGILCLVLFSALGITTIFVLYAAILLVILGVLGMPRLWWMRTTLVAIGWMWFFPALNQWSNTLWFQQIQDFPANSRTLFTAYSPYQKVDVLQDPDGNRYLFLDSMEHFGSPIGIWLNIIMGRIPASLIEPENAVVFGGGSMELEWMISNYSDHVTTVEIDPVVVDVSLRLFTDYNHMDKLANRTVIIDDAKHFIANTEEHYDLIVSALPAAFTIQTGALYSTSFFEQVQAHLNPGGVFVVNLTSTFTPDDLTTRRIAASLLATFDEVLVVTSSSVGLSFAYASDELPFSMADVRAGLELNAETDYAIFETDTVRAIVGDAQPITLDSLDVILRASADLIVSRVRGR